MGALYIETGLVHEGFALGDCHLSLALALSSRLVSFLREEGKVLVASVLIAKWGRYTNST